MSERASDDDDVEQEEGGEDGQWIIGLKSGRRHPPRLPLLLLREETGFGISGRDVVNVIGILLGRVAE